MDGKKFVPQISGQEILSTLFYLYLSFYLIGRSIFFITVEDEMIVKNEWYAQLNYTFDFRVWSTITILAGVLIFISIFATSIRGLVALVAGNSLAFFVYSVFSLTGVTHGTSWFAAYMNAVSATFHLILIVWGVWTIFQIKKKST